MQTIHVISFLVFHVVIENVICNVSILLLTEDESEKLTFHPQCGAHASVINGQRTAHRPK